MAALGMPITVGTSATLLFEVIDEPTYNALSNPAANILPAHEAGDSLPILLSFPSGSTVYLGGSDVTASSTDEGCAVFGPTTVAYNAVGSDSLYAVVGSSTVAVGVLFLRQ